LKISVIVPTFNEAENISRLVPAIYELPLPDLSILIVDDNSSDGTGEIADDFSRSYPERFRVLHRQGKMGLGTAYIQGFELALEDGVDAVAQMDADFSHPPEKLVELAQALEECDIAIGSRYVPGGGVDRQWPLWRKGLSAFGNLYARTILSMNVRDCTGGYRLYRREVLNKMPLERVRSSGYVFQIEMAYLANLLGFTFREVPIYFADRKLGQSKMSLRIQMEAAIRVWYLPFAYRDLNRSS